MGSPGKPRPLEGKTALFDAVQGRILGLLFGQPERRFGGSELIQLARGGTGAAHRQLRRLAEEGLVTVARIGNQRHYQANPSAPIFKELHGLVLKTVGLAGPIRAALQPLAKQIRVAFVFGSVARGATTATSDVDLVVISDSLTYPDVIDAVATAEQTLARRVNPVVMTSAEWKRRRHAKDSFVARVMKAPRMFIIGDEHDA